MCGLGLGGALVGAALLVLQRAQLSLALAHLALEVLELALDPAQLGRLLLGLGQRRAHPVEIELHRLQLAAEAVDERLALAQQVVEGGLACTATIGRPSARQPRRSARS